MISSQISQLGTKLQYRFNSWMANPANHELFSIKLRGSQEEQQAGGLALCVSAMTRSPLLINNKHEPVEALYFELRGPFRHKLPMQKQNRREVAVHWDNSVLRLLYLYVDQEGNPHPNGEFVFKNTGHLSHERIDEVAEAVLSYLLRLQPQERAQLLDRRECDELPDYGISE